MLLLQIKILYKIIQMGSLLKQAFEQAAVQNYWSDADSLSGPGSNMQQTRVIREKIPLLLEKYGITKMLDAPCGDLFWMKEILPLLNEKGIQYEGADIVSVLIEKHRLNFASVGPLGVGVGPIQKSLLSFA